MANENYGSLMQDSKNTFNRNYRGNRLKQLHRDKGGSIVDLVDKVAAAKVPTLVLGIGGIGCTTVNRTKKKFTERVRQDTQNPTVFFLAIDTCKEDLNKHVIGDMHRDGYLASSEAEFINSDLSKEVVDVVSNVKAKDSQLPQKEWMDLNLPDSLKVSDQGAKSQRQMGRLALSAGNNYGNLYSKIKEVIKKMKSKAPIDRTNSGQRSVNIVLIAGISGGTGSGTIVDISYMLRRASESIGGIHLSVDAIVYTPEVQDNVPSHIVPNLQRNFVAAIKELDAYIKSTNNKEVYRFASAEFPDGIVTDEHGGNDVASGVSIFDSCTIVQGYDAAGGKIDWSIPIDTVSSYVVNLASDITVKSQDNPVPLQRAIFDNEVNNVSRPANTYVMNNPNVPRDVYYSYRTLGYHEVTFPIEAIMTYVANKTTEALQRKYSVAPKKSALNVLSAVGLMSGDSVEAFCRNAFSLGGNSSIAAKIQQMTQYNFDDIKRAPGPAPHDSELQKKGYSADWIDSVYGGLVTNITSEMKESGPYASLRLSTDISNMLRDYIQRLVNYGPALAKRISTFSDEISALIKKAKNDTFNPLSSNHLSKEQKEDLVTAFNKKTRERELLVWQKHYLNHAVKALSDLGNKLVKKHNEVFTNYVGAFCAINEVLEQDSTAIVNTAMQVDGGRRVFSSSMINLADLSDSNSRLQDFVKYYLTSARIDSLSERLIDAMLGDETAWTTDMQKFKGDEVLKEQFKTQFSDFTKDIIQRFMVVKYTDGCSVDVEQVCADMNRFLNDPELADPWIDFDKYCKDTYGVAPLTKAAEDIFNEATRIGHCAVKGSGRIPGSFNDFFNYKLVCLTTKTPHINRIICGDGSTLPGLPAYHAWKAANGVVADADISEVFCIHVVCGVPLYFFKNMDENQKMYTEALHSRNAADRGMHMDHGVNTGWAKFPPPLNNDALRLIFGSNAVYRQDYKDEEEIMSEVKRAADLCKDKYGMIRRETPSDDFYTLHYYQEYPGLSIEECFNKTIALYEEDVKAAIAVTGQIDIESDDPEKAWEDSFEANLSAKTLMDYMQEGGYPLKERSLRLDDCVGLDFTDTGDYNAAGNAVSGGFYKTIRRSTESRTLLAQSEKMYTKLYEEFEQRRVELTKQAKKEALTEYYRQKQEALVDLFIKSIITRNAAIRHDPARKRFEVDIKDTKGSNLRPINKVVPYASALSYEKAHLLYAAFACFFLTYREGDVRFWNAYRERVIDSYNDYDEEAFRSTFIEMCRLAPDILCGELDDAATLEEIDVAAVNEAFEKEAGKKAAFAPMNQTYLTLDSFFNGYDFGYTLGSQIYAFYKYVKNYFVDNFGDEDQFVQLLQAAQEPASSQGRNGLSLEKSPEF